MSAHDSTASLSDVLKIPALSPGLTRLHRLLPQKRWSLDEVAAALADDPDLCGQIITVANNTRSRRDPEVKSIAQAMFQLGLCTFNMVATRAAAMAAFSGVASSEAFSTERFWRHATLSAHLSRALAGQMPAGKTGLSAEQFYACGLLHDIGKLVLFENFGPTYAELLQKLGPQADSSALEDAQLGGNHGQVGSLVAVLWSLPDPMPTVIGMHHDPQLTGSVADVVRIVACADEIAHWIAGGLKMSPDDLVRKLTRVPEAMPAKGLVDVVSEAQRMYDEGAL